MDGPPKDFYEAKELLIAGNLELYEHPKLIQQLKNSLWSIEPTVLSDVSGGTGAG